MCCEAGPEALALLRDLLPLLPEALHLVARGTKEDLDHGTIAQPRERAQWRVVGASKPMSWDGSSREERASVARSYGGTEDLRGSDVKLLSFPDEWC